MKTQRVAHRRARLRHLIDTDYGPWEGAQARFLEATKRDGRYIINQGELSGLLANKSFGEAKSENLAAALGLDLDWFETYKPTPREAQQAKRKPGHTALEGARSDQRKGKDHGSTKPVPTRAK